ncbi:RNA polymerase sigma-70 factor (ECF subfamily) [Streptomyces sp. B3I7]|uniref:sigma-70 family RNA polymerase sigma factor n=1 Tax=Streptomyces sp. B3I7 TaxID=3042269 RepID=UPI0027853BB6|nr:sigma-70 family RNA polymerase sigma factor [Streptomyces sp. B3I7]MDQ0808386.1 RNA polymerase sigma-70 factor (ECF subfamily) [Streptomyces sp. B3I7]
MIDASSGPREPFNKKKILDSVYNECAPDLLRYVLKLTGGDHHKSEDIVQEALLRAWSKHLPDDRGHIRPWLFRVAKNIVIDEYRKKNSRPSEVEITELALSESGDFDGTLSEVVVGNALKNLSQAHREVLYETFFLGQTIAEASTRLNIPVGTVKSRMYYALKILKGKLVDL